MHEVYTHVYTCIYMYVHVDVIQLCNSSVEGATELKFTPFCSS